MRIKLTTAQRSALECADLGQPEDRALLEAWDRSGDFLECTDETRDVIADLLTELANGEDALAENSNADATMRRQARAACKALTNLSRKVDAHG